MEFSFLFSCLFVLIFISETRGWIGKISFPSSTSILSRVLRKAIHPFINTNTASHQQSFPSQLPHYTVTSIDSQSSSYGSYVLEAFDDDCTSTNSDNNNNLNSRNIETSLESRSTTGSTTVDDATSTMTYPTTKASTPPQQSTSSAVILAPSISLSLASPLSHRNKKLSHELTSLDSQTSMAETGSNRLQTSCYFDSRKVCCGDSVCSVDGRSCSANRAYLDHIYHSNNHQRSRPISSQPTGRSGYPISNHPADPSATNPSSPPPSAAAAAAHSMQHFHSMTRRPPPTNSRKTTAGEESSSFSFPVQVPPQQPTFLRLSNPSSLPLVLLENSVILLGKVILGMFLLADFVVSHLPRPGRPEQQSQGQSQGKGQQGLGGQNQRPPLP